MGKGFTGNFLNLILSPLYITFFGNYKKLFIHKNKNLLTNVKNRVYLKYYIKKEMKGYIRLY